MIPERYAPYVYALFRIVFGFLFIFHGLQKVFGLFDGRTADMFSLRQAAGIIELVAGVLITPGAYARPAAFIASGEMAVGYFLVQQPMGFWPIQKRRACRSLLLRVSLYRRARRGTTQRRSIVQPRA